VAAAHPEFQGTVVDGQTKVVTFFDFGAMAANNPNPFGPAGDNYHRTACAGVAAAKADNPSGVGMEVEGGLGGGAQLPRPRGAGRVSDGGDAEDGKVAKVPLLHRDGEALESVDDALAKPKRESKSTRARELILDLLEERGRTESDALDAEVAQRTGLAARTVRDLRGALRNDGLVQSEKAYGEGGIERWYVVRTNAPRPECAPSSRCGSRVGPWPLTRRDVRTYLPTVLPVVPLNR
jgi:hypothetical protein